MNTRTSSSVRACDADFVCLHNQSNYLLESLGTINVYYTRIYCTSFYLHKAA